MSHEARHFDERKSGSDPGRQVLRGLLFTAVLVAVIVFVGSLTYDDKLDRSRVAEAIVVAEGCREAIGAFVEDRKAFPSTAGEAGCNVEPTKYAESVRFNGTRLELTLKGIGRALDGTVLILEPISGVEGTTRDSSRGRGGGWRCWTNAAPEAYKYFPAYCRQSSLAR